MLVVLVVKVVTLVVVLVVVSPQSGGTGFVAALHAAASALLASLHVFVQGLSLPQAALHVVNSLAMSFLQSFLHAPWAGEAVSAAPMSSTAHPASHSTPAFMTSGRSIVPAQARGQGKGRLGSERDDVVRARLHVALWSLGFGDARGLCMALGCPTWTQ